MRTISDIELRSLKAATDGAYLLAGGISRVVDFTRVNTGTLSKYASFNAEYRENFIPVDVMIEVERRAKTPTIAKEVAAILGYGLVPLTSEAADNAPLQERDAYNVLLHSAGCAQSILEALANDGRIDPMEREVIIGKVLELRRAIDATLARVWRRKDD